MRRVAVPWPVLALLTVAVVVLAVQGSRMAADRSARLQPAPVVATLRLPCEPVTNSDRIEVRRIARHSAVLLTRSCQARLALVQVFPERELLRWMESGPSQRSLTLPLEGLEAGIYRILTVPENGAEGPQEMDVPDQKWPTLARFELPQDTPRSDEP